MHDLEFLRTMFAISDCRNDAQASVEPVPHLETYASHERMAGSSEDMPLNGTINKVDMNIQSNFIAKYHCFSSCLCFFYFKTWNGIFIFMGVYVHLQSEEIGFLLLIGS